jgi:hypothetical protein
MHAAACASGDKPELRWREASDELRAMGYSSTLEYVEAAAGAVLRHTGVWDMECCLIVVAQHAFCFLINCLVSV